MSTIVVCTHMYKYIQRHAPVCTLTGCLLVCLQDGFVAAKATRLTSAEKDIDYDDVIIINTRWLPVPRAC